MHLPACFAPCPDVLEPLREAIVLRGGRLVLAGLNAQPKSVMERSGFLEKSSLMGLQPRPDLVCIFF